MRKLFFALAILFGALFSSCNFTEELHLNENGSGKISLNFNGDELMAMAGDEMVKEGEKAIDSVMYFKDFLKEKQDSIAQLSAQEQARLKRLENFAMRMVMNPEAKKMKLNLFTEFTSVNELSDMLGAFQDASALQGNNSNQESKNNPMSAKSDATSVKYTYANNRFSRKTTITNKELHQQTIDSLKEGSMFLGSSTYTLKYHFPKKVKSVSSNKALLSPDGKTLTLETDFLTYIKDPKALDIEVELEN